MQRGAIFSDDRDYRFVLWRIWDDNLPRAMFIGLNPSTANETEDDPTLLRCVHFARDWGYGGLYMTNLFAFVATDPRLMLAAREPVGTDNDSWLRDLASEVNLAVAGWGELGAHRDRSRLVSKMLPALHCLRQNRSGEPTHPLYLPRTLRPVRFNREQFSTKFALKERG